MIHFKLDIDNMKKDEVRYALDKIIAAGIASNEYKVVKDNVDEVLYKPFPNPLNDYDNSIRVSGAIFEKPFFFHQIEEYSHLISFNNCVFKGGVCFTHQSLEVEFRNCVFYSFGPRTDTGFQKLLIFDSLFLDDLAIDFVDESVRPVIHIQQNDIVGSVKIGDVFRDDYKKIKEFKFEECKVTDDFELKCFKEIGIFCFKDNIACRNIILNNMTISGKADIRNNSTRENTLFSLRGIHFSNTVYIDFQNIKGKILFTETLVSGSVYFYEDYLRDNDYNQLKIYDESFISANFEYFKNANINETHKTIGYLVTKWNFYNVSVLFRSNENQSADRLKCYYWFKHNDRLRKKSKLKGFNIKQRLALFFEFLIEKTTGYFTSSKNILLTSTLFIIFFSILNFIFYQSFGTDVTGDKLVNSIYFSLVSFTTIGYGDLSHTYNFMKMLSAIQGLLGILLTASLVTTFTRRYLS